MIVSFSTTTSSSRSHGLATVAFWAMFLLVTVNGQAINNKMDDPVMAGYDLVAYHTLLDPSDDGIPGTPDYQTRHNGYLFFFSSPENLLEFESNPNKYLPKYGGFCAWGVAWEYQEDGWPWAANHVGPPCGPRDGWALLTDPTSGETRLYCSIWRSYQDDFNANQQEGIRLADERWMEWYGSLDAGPYNNGCYAWNWQDCFAKSIYDPSHDNNGSSTLPNNDSNSASITVTIATATPDSNTAFPTTAPTRTALFRQEDESDLTINWSDKVIVMNGALTFQWTLGDITTVRPVLIVDLVYRIDDEFESVHNEYVGFGIAEQVMQGALVVCSPKDQEDGGGNVARTAWNGTLVPVATMCKTYMGAGMGITRPDVDPVRRTVLESGQNATHYHVRFSASLFGCWSNPVWPARLLFSRGLVSGNGDPMPHRNNPLHRQAVAGVELLSVVEHVNGFNATLASHPGDAPQPSELETLPSSTIQQIEGTTGSLEILDGRVTLDYGLYLYGPEEEEVVRIQLQNVPFDPDDEEQENTYIGFGFAKDTMSGLVVTCAPSIVWKDGEGPDTVEKELTATCHQWRGSGTNLYPRSVITDAGGWFLENLEGNGTHVNYTLAGRVKDVIVATGLVEATTNLRAICAVGRTAPDTGTPLMHSSSGDRTPMFLSQLAAAPKRH